MKKNLLTSLTVLAITLAVSTTCFANDNYYNFNPDGTVTDPINGLVINNPAGGDDETTTTTGTGGCDPLESGWEACLKSTPPTIAIGGDQGAKMEKAYNDTQGNASESNVDSDDETDDHEPNDQDTGEDLDGEDGLDDESHTD